MGIDNRKPVFDETLNPKYEDYDNAPYNNTNDHKGHLGTEDEIRLELWAKRILDRAKKFNIGTPPVEEPSVVPAIYFDDPIITYIDEDNNRTTYDLNDLGGSVDSVFGRVGVVTAQSGDYTASQITETATKVFVTPSEKTAITHSNRDVLDATTASFTTADETKLDGIEAGAEVNNISDANATDLTDGGTTSLHNHDDIYTRTSSLGDLATLDTVDTAQIDNHAVTNTKLAHMNANTVKGRLSGNGTPQDIAMADLPISTATQTALNGKLPSTNTKAQFDTACTDDNFAFLNQAQTFTGNQTINGIIYSSPGVAERGIEGHNWELYNRTSVIRLQSYSGLPVSINPLGNDLLVNGQNRTNGRTSYTPTVFGDSGSVGSYINQQGKYKIIGKTCFFHVSVRFTKGTLSGIVQCNLPFSVQSGIDSAFSGWISNTSDAITALLGLARQGAGSTMTFQRTVRDATLVYSTLGSDVSIQASGCYEIA